MKISHTWALLELPKHKMSLSWATLAGRSVKVRLPAFSCFLPVLFNLALANLQPVWPVVDGWSHLVGISIKTGDRNQRDLLCPAFKNTASGTFGAH